MDHGNNLGLVQCFSQTRRAKAYYSATKVKTDFTVRVQPISYLGTISMCFET